MSRPPVLTVDVTAPKEFEAECAQLCEAGYRMASCNVGFVNSEQYDFASSYMAIFVDDGVMVTERRAK